ncbi:monovalent cation/H+ antiporter subunit D family protein [Halobacterium sp. KA-4]|uniref:proton-conducting transporter transmembrane domain-containing protein n=1 Tax=Halobacterium sp. KA-4 TaxID=2896367 RepID=UPI001E3F6322|nr:proton-conducting transporter membrane subunit [Halobacterium sp. KA-4]MCD2201130.1 monovalent cation/H+ antiporter subunit D family protein [Halobacterium sp. KA-4]
MTEITSIRPLAAVLVSAVAVAPILASNGRPNAREAWTMLAALAKFGLVASMVPAALAGDVYVTKLGQLVPYVEFTLRADSLGLLFALLASTLWIVTSFYSMGYMRGLDEDHQTRYFAAFAGSVSSAVGVAFASNLVVLYVFYELLTVATYPLVAHDGTDEARAAGRKYLAYTFGGGVAVLAGTLLVVYLTGTTAFTTGGISALASADPTLARAAFALLVTGFGVKAALMPLHSWLPDAMVAPTPVSGLLHAVAVVKSGVFGIARVLLDVFGIDLVAELGVGGVLAAVAAFTLVVASVIALRQDHLKRRLAFSTISQLSYIVLGIAVAGAVGPGEAAKWALIGGLLHIPAHAFMKLTLFFCAGAVHVETHVDYISEMAGIGKRMPLTMGAFAVAAAGMAGIPLIAGFVSKYFLLIGTVSSGNLVFTGALLLSGILNIAYFWPVVYTAFFESAEGSDEKPLVSGPLGGRFGGEARTDGGHDHGHGAFERRAPNGAESTWFILGPILFAAAGSVVLGVVPDTAVFLQLVRDVANTAVGVVA